MTFGSTNPPHARVPHSETATGISLEGIRGIYRMRCVGKMQHQDIVLFPPNHEQSLPSFHVRAEVADDFRAHLEAAGFLLAQPPESLDAQGPGANNDLVEFLVDSEASIEHLDESLSAFLAKAG